MIEHILHHNEKLYRTIIEGESIVVQTDATIFYNYIK